MDRLVISVPLPWTATDNLQSHTDRPFLASTARSALRNARPLVQLVHHSEITWAISSSFVCFLTTLNASVGLIHGVWKGFWVIPSLEKMRLISSCEFSPRSSVILRPTLSDRFSPESPQTEQTCTAQHPSDRPATPVS